MSPGTDVVGSTAIAEKLNPEERCETVARLHRTLGEIIEQHRERVTQCTLDLAIQRER